MPAKAPRERASTPTDLLTIRTAADRLDCSENHIYRLIASGVLEAVDISQPGAKRSKTRVRSDELAAYIDSRSRRAQSAPAA